MFRKIGLNLFLLMAVCFSAGCIAKPTAADETQAAREVLQKFYEGHIPESPYTPQGDVKWEESGLVSQEYTQILKDWNYNSEVFNAEPFLCAQANPPEWKIGEVKVDGSQAEGVVEMMFGETLHAVSVYLIKEDGNWKINATECFPVK